MVHFLPGSMQKSPLFPEKTHAKKSTFPQKACENVHFLKKKHPPKSGPGYGPEDAPLDIQWSPPLCFVDVKSLLILSLFSIKLHNLGTLQVSHEIVTDFISLANHCCSDFIKLMLSTPHGTIKSQRG